MTAELTSGCNLPNWVTAATCEYKVSERGTWKFKLQYQENNSCDALGHQKRHVSKIDLFYDFSSLQEGALKYTGSLGQHCLPKLVFKLKDNESKVSEYSIQDLNNHQDAAYQIKKYQGILDSIITQFEKKEIYCEPEVECCDEGNTVVIKNVKLNLKVQE